MKPTWLRMTSRRARETALLLTVGVAMFAFAVVGNSMTRPLDRLLDAGDRDAGSIQVVTQHVSR